MQIVVAHEEEAAPVRALVARQMAEALVLRGCNLQDDVALIATLTLAGFGVPTIRSMRAEAVLIASGMTMVTVGGVQ